MAGLKYGYKYTSKKGIRTKRETGVVKNDLNNKWTVRVISKGQVKTLAQFDTEEEANKYYDSYGL